MKKKPVILSPSHLQRITDHTNEHTKTQTQRKALDVQ